MSKQLLAIKTRLEKVRPWMYVALALAMILMSYYILIGLRYLNSSKKVSFLTDQIYNISAAVQSNVPNTQALEKELSSLEDNLRVKLQAFQYSPDDLIATLVATSRETNVNLTTITTVEVSSLSKEGIIYMVQPFNLTLSGETKNIYQFISRLQETLPAIGVSGVRITGVEKQPQVNLQVTFYVSPSLPNKG